MSPGLATTFRSLRVRNYRLFAGGQVVSLTGTWAQRVAQDWLVLELSGGSGVALGVVTGLQFLPVLLFGMYGGVLADRYDKRRLLIGAQAVMAVLALCLAALDLSGAVQLWHVFALAFALGLATAVDTPVRQAFVVEMVGPDDVPNAVSLNSVTFNTARIVGPALAAWRSPRWAPAGSSSPTPSATPPCCSGSARCAPTSCSRRRRWPRPRDRRARGCATCGRGPTCWS
jgi:MFS family permease